MFKNNFFKKYHLVLLTTIFILIILSFSFFNKEVVSQTANLCANNICRVAPNSNLVISAHGEAWLIINTDLSKEIFIPIQTATEWAQFRLHYPAHITLEVPGDPCVLPWGGTIDHLQSVTAYQHSTVALPGICQSQERVCNDTILSGSYENETCFEILDDCGTVNYDNYIYNTVKMNEQCWLTENLKAGEMLNYTSQSQTNNSVIEKFCLNNDINNCEQNGGLYTWDEAMQYSQTEGSQGICPTGWHIPTNQEWLDLELFARSLDDYSNIDRYSACDLRTSNTVPWRCDGAGNHLKSVSMPFGTNNSYFNAKASGFIEDDTSIDTGAAYFWLSSQINNTPISTSVGPYTLNNTVMKHQSHPSNTAYPVRCIADYYEVNYEAERGGRIEGIAEQRVKIGDDASSVTAVANSGLTEFSHWSDGVTTATRQDLNVNEPLSVTAHFNSRCKGEIEYEGKKYPIVAIGDRCWFAEDLDVGVRITSSPVKLPSDNGTIEKYCPLLSGYKACEKGALYTPREMTKWEDVHEGMQGICPTGWHLPSVADWHNLEQTVFQALNLQEPTLPCPSSESEFLNISNRCGEINRADIYANENGATKALLSKEVDRSSGFPDYFRGTDLFGFSWINDHYYIYASSGYSSISNNIYHSYQIIHNFNDQPALSSYDVFVHFNRRNPHTAMINSETSKFDDDFSEWEAKYFFATPVRCVMNKNTLSYSAEDDQLGYIAGESFQEVASGQMGTIVTATPYYDNVEFVAWSDGVTTASRQDSGGEPLVVSAIFKTNCPETITHDGYEYKVINIGPQCWLAENLNSNNYVSGNSICHPDDNADCSIYGRYYDLEASGSACPSGWELPDLQSIEGLENYINNNTNTVDQAGRFLKSCFHENPNYCSNCLGDLGCSSDIYPIWREGWNEDEHGVDLYGFNALATGFYNLDDLSFDDKGDYSFLYNKSKFSYLSLSSDQIYSIENQPSMWVNIRCVKSESYQLAPTQPIVLEQNGTSIVLQEIENGEYRLGSGSWQSSPIFTGLEEVTNYTFYQRFAATANKSASPVSEELTVNSNCLNVIFNGLEYKSIYKHGKCWLDRNLGASRVCAFSSDSNCYGDLFQWGRNADGHEFRNSQTTSTLSSTDVPGHSNWIITSSSPFDWRSSQNDNLWQGVTGINNPCPSGYRLPTKEELETESSSWPSANSTGAYSSSLKWPISARRYNSGTINTTYTNIWSSTISGSNAFSLQYGSSDAYFTNTPRSYGYAVRCLKDFSSSDIPTLLLRTENTIILDTVSGVEYGIGETPSWQASPEFTGLQSDTNYTFYLRVISSGIISNSAVFKTDKLSCSLPWGGEINHGISIKSYSNTLIDGCCIEPIRRVCDNGILLGDENYNQQNCVGDEFIYNYNGSPWTASCVVKNGLNWLDRNLGASRVAISYDDSQAYGDLFQWGRNADGHEFRNSQTTSTLSSTDVPGHSNYIITSSSPFDWRSSQNDNLWQGVTGINNPCPSGYRLPTKEELETESSSWPSANSTGAYSSSLKWPISARRYNSGTINTTYTNIWSSTISGSNASSLLYGSSDAYFTNTSRSYGCAVRCVKELGEINAPTLATRTETSITLNEVAGFEYSMAGTSEWQGSSEFTGLQFNTEYVFYHREISTGLISSAATFSTVSCGDNITFNYNGLDVTYGTINRNDRCWLDRNLGAFRVAISYDDSQAYGDLFQWGRSADGHQLRNSEITSTLSSNDVPGHNDFIITSLYPYDWRSSQNDNLWQGVTGINNPCPSGWRIPTNEELLNEENSWSGNSLTDIHSSTLKWPANGQRENTTAALNYVNSSISVWSSSVTQNYAYYLNKDYTYSNWRSKGAAVRCIRELETFEIKPILLDRTAHTITLNTVSGVEYSIENSSYWQSDPEFTGLNSDTEYTFYLKNISTGMISDGIVFRTDKLPCTLPWGGVISHNESVSAYSSNLNSKGCCRAPITRVCDDGVLLGDNNYSLEIFSCIGDDIIYNYNGSPWTATCFEMNGNNWLDRNLGATRACLTADDAECYGDLFQWGRLDDGHQVSTSNVTSSVSATYEPGHSDFIVTGLWPNDWISPQYSSFWQGVTGINNPCPSGWRVPTSVEFENVAATWSHLDGERSFDRSMNTPFKMAKGIKRSHTGVIEEYDYEGSYTTNTPLGSYHWHIQASNGLRYSNQWRGAGRHLRCVTNF